MKDKLQGRDHSYITSSRYGGGVQKYNIMVLHLLYQLSIRLFRYVSWELPHVLSNVVTYHPHYGKE